MANQDIINKELDALHVSKSFKCQPEKCIQFIRDPTKGLKILHLNIRSINKNFDEVVVLMRLLGFQCDVLILTECWLSKLSHLPTLDDFTSYSTNITYNQNDGCVIYVKSSIKANIKEPVFADANCLVCCIEDITIVAIYRPPSFKNIDNFIDSLDSVLKIGTSSVVLIGDMNIDIRVDNTDSHSDDYLNCTASNGLLPAHLFPTRLSNCLDHILIKTNKRATAFVIESSITDHEPTLLFLCNRSVHSDVTRTRAKLDCDSAIESIKTHDWSPILSISDPNDAADALIGKLSSIVTEHTHIQVVPRKQRNLKPWITPGLLRCIRHRDRMHIKLKKSANNEILKITYTRYRNYCNSLLRKLKRSYEKELFRNAKNNVKATWNVIKKVSELQTQCSPSSELVNLLDNPKSSLNYVNNFFANVGSSLASKFKSSSMVSNPVANSQSCGSMMLLEVTELDVESIILGLRTDCATGYDCIPSKIIKGARKVLVPIVTHVCNLCISAGVFPKTFKKALVHPIHKSGCKDDVNNYRPISILSAMSKILERVLNKNLISFLESNNILAKNQYGFRNGVSTEDAVLHLSNHVARTLDRKRKCLGIFLDLSKAFDTVSAPALLRKMERLGIRGLPLKIFADYLKDRTQIVKIGQYESDELPMTFGVPQGSILGPTLFLIYINDLCTLPLDNCMIYTYADDTALIVEGCNWTQAYQNAEAALCCVMKCLSDNLLTLNADKTVYVPFAIKSNQCPSNSLTLKAHHCGSLAQCSCLSLTKTTHVRYLGVLIDQHLNWHPHIAKVTSRVRKLIYVFKKLRNSADLETLKIVYLALCRSVLTYCLPVWGGATQNVFIRLERAQRAVLKVMLSLPRRYPTMQLYSDCNFLTVRQLYVLLSALRKHSTRPPMDSTCRRKYNVFTHERHRTAFARRQFYVNSGYLYNFLNKKLNIYSSPKYHCKNLLIDYLHTLNYDNTEDLLLGKLL